MQTQRTDHPSPHAVEIPDLIFYPGTDLGSAVSLSLKVGSHYRYLPRSNQWVIYCDSCGNWVTDHGDVGITGAAAEAAYNTYELYEEHPDPYIRQAVFEAMSADRIRAVVYLARSRMSTELIEKPCHEHGERRRQKDTVADKLVETLTDRGPMTAVALSKALEKSSGTVRAQLSRHKNRFVKTGDGRWNVAEISA